MLFSSNAMCHAVFDDRIYLALRSSDAAALPKAQHVRMSASWETDAFSFRHVRPESLAAVLHFFDLITQKLGDAECERVVFCVESPEPAKLLQAKFILGSYLVLKHNCSPAEAWVCLSTFHPLDRDSDEPSFSSRSDPSSEQEMLDSWEALVISNQLGWIGSFELAEVLHYNSPFEGDLHWIVPDKLLALRCPTVMPCSDVPYVDVPPCRYFSPGFYVEPFRDMKVGCVVSLNDHEHSGYTPTLFEKEGFRCVKLEFDEDAKPPIHTVLEFLRVVDEAGDAAVAVHCRTGHIQTAAMIAMYLMRTWKFSSSATMAWLRLTRAGSLTPEHEHLLRSVEAYRDGATNSSNFNRFPTSSNSDHDPTHSELFTQPWEDDSEAIHHPRCCDVAVDEEDDFHHYSDHDHAKAPGQGGWELKGWCATRRLTGTRDRDRPRPESSYDYLQTDSAPILFDAVLNEHSSPGGNLEGNRDRDGLAAGPSRRETVTVTARQRGMASERVPAARFFSSVQLVTVARGRSKWR